VKECFFWLWESWYFRGSGNVQIRMIKKWPILTYFLLLLWSFSVWWGQSTCMFSAGWPENSRRISSRCKMKNFIYFF
jgi:hypothetical protein